MLEPTVDIAITDAPRSRSLRVSSAWLPIAAYAVAIVMGLAYVGWLVSLHSYPFQDFPNHLARGVALKDLIFQHGAHYSSVFSLHWAPVPYVLHDLALATFIELFGARWGGGLFLAIVLLSLPLALMFYMWAARLAPSARPVVFLLALYLSTDSFFLLAFMGFRLALAFVIVSLGWAQLLRRQWHRGAFALYVITLACGYLIHLTATVFFAPVLAVSSAVHLLYRRSTLRREIYLWIPLALLMLLHVTVLAPARSAANPITYEYYWGTWQFKLQSLGFELSRFASHFDVPMLLLLLACLLWPIRRYLQLHRLRQAAVLEPVAIAIIFLGAYIAMPQFYADSSYVDVRALPVVVLMLLLAVLNVADTDCASFATPTVLGLALVLCLANLGFLVRHVGKYEQELNRYRDLARMIPADSRVLPIHTRPKDGNLRPLLHAGGYVVVDRAAVIPYLFAGDRGDPMKYFRYLHRPYWPQEDWYRARLGWDRAIEQTYVVEGETYRWRLFPAKAQGQWHTADLIPVDWNSIACTYDYLLATSPIDPKMIEAPVRRIGSNESAELFAVDRSACRPALLSGAVPVRAISAH